jgi:hypothetical protein
MTQLAKQNNSIGVLVSNLPSKDVQLYDNYKGAKKLVDFKGNDDMNKIVEIVGQWVYYLGLTDSVSEKDIILVTKFIQENYPTLNLFDLKEAIRLSSIHELDVETNSYGKFSPIYVSSILNAYIDKRRDVIHKVNQLKNKALSEQNTYKPTPEERLKNIKTILRHAYEDAFISYYDDFGDILYDLIKERKLINVDEKLIEDAKKFANSSYREQQRKSNLKSVIQNANFEKLDADKIKRKEARKYIVNVWLRSFNNEDFNRFIIDFK